MGTNVTSVFDQAAVTSVPDLLKLRMGASDMLGGPNYFAGLPVTTLVSLRNSPMGGNAASGGITT